MTRQNIYFYIYIHFSFLILLLQILTFQEMVGYDTVTGEGKFNKLNMRRKLNSYYCKVKKQNQGTKTRSQHLVLKQSRSSAGAPRAQELISLNVITYRCS